MHRNVTAIYRTYATADLVRRELSELGISSGYIHLIPDTEDGAATTGATGAATSGTTGARGDTRYSDQLHDLHLPDDDLRMYQQSVRRGDYVVSVEVDEDQVSRVQQIMRRPETEAYDLDRHRNEFDDAALDPYSTPDTRRTDADWLAQRDAGYDDPYTRSYTRNRRLDERRG
jgi:hypothetical protein